MRGTGIEMVLRTQRGPRAGSVSTVGWHTSVLRYAKRPHRRPSTGVVGNPRFPDGVILALLCDWVSAGLGWTGGWRFTDNSRTRPVGFLTSRRRPDHLSFHYPKSLGYSLRRQGGQNSRRPHSGASSKRGSLRWRVIERL